MNRPKLQEFRDSVESELELEKKNPEALSKTTELHIPCSSIDCTNYENECNEIKKPSNGCLFAIKKDNNVVYVLKKTEYGVKYVQLKPSYTNENGDDEDVLEFGGRKSRRKSRRKIRRKSRRKTRRKIRRKSRRKL